VYELKEIQSMRQIISTSCRLFWLIQTLKELSRPVKLVKWAKKPLGC